MQGQNVHVIFAREAERVVERKPFRVSTSLSSLARFGVVHQDAAHHLGSQPEKLSAISPVHVALVHQPQISLVDQCGRLKSMA